MHLAEAKTTLNVQEEKPRVGTSNGVKYMNITFS